MDCLLREAVTDVIGGPQRGPSSEGGVAHDGTTSNPHWTDVNLYLTAIGPQLAVSSLLDFPCGHLIY